MLGENVNTQREMQSAVDGLTDHVGVVSTADNLFELTATIGDSMTDVENAALAQDVVQKLIDISRKTPRAIAARSPTRRFLDQQLSREETNLRPPKPGASHSKPRTPS